MEECCIELQQVELEKSIKSSTAEQDKALADFNEKIQEFKKQLTKFDAQLEVAGRTTVSWYGDHCD